MPGPRFHAMIGETFMGLVPSLNNAKYITFKLLSVDVGGLWIESQRYIEQMLEMFGADSSQNTPVIFLPFSSILHVIHLADYPALSEKGLGF
jgi:hypothetical protein